MRLVKIVREFSEVSNTGQGTISISFNKLWHDMTDDDVDFLLEDVDDFEFGKRLTAMKKAYCKDVIKKI